MKTHQMFPLHTTVFEETLGREIIIVTSSFFLFKMFSVHTKMQIAFSNSSGRFEELLLSDWLVWTIDLTIKLRFQIYPASCRLGLLFGHIPRVTLVFPKFAATISNTREGFLVFFRLRYSTSLVPQRWSRLGHQEISRLGSAHDNLWSTVIHCIYSWTDWTCSCCLLQGQPGTCWTTKMKEHCLSTFISRDYSDYNMM